MKFCYHYNWLILSSVFSQNTQKEKRPQVIQVPKNTTTKTYSLASVASNDKFRKKQLATSSGIRCYNEVESVI